MKLFSKKKTGMINENKIALEKSSHVDAEQKFLTGAIQTFLLFLKDFALDFDEVNPAGFKKDIDELGAKLLSGAKIGSISSGFEKYKGKIAAFIQKQKINLKAREKEFKNIIDLLTRAVTAINTENQNFNQRIYEQSGKMEAITKLDDIIKIKNALQFEVEQLRQTVDEKQLHDDLHVKELSIQVSSLKTDLERAKTEALTDGLTGVFNRKAFDDYLKDLVDRSEVMGSFFAVLMLDLDHFKVLNDTYGHQTGDRVLLAFANQCSKFIRKQDFIARYGGEEFAVVLPGASLRIAVKRARQICKATASLRFAADDAGSGQILAFTVSIGVSAFKNRDTVATVIERADRALYQAKQNGRDRVVSEKKIKL